MSRVALFESWRGRYDDSPRALSEHLATARPDLRRVWVRAGHDVSFPSDVATVTRHSPQYFALLFTARYVVSNDMIPRHYAKSPRSTYVQTWHGTPLKKIGFDVVGARYAGADAYHRRLARDVRRWDVLLSPGPWCTQIFRQAFHYSGRVLETGYPRNDVLRSADADERRAAVRAALGLQQSVTAVLYAPTWRDDPTMTGGFDAAAVAEALGELVRRTPSDVVVLVRMHRLVRDRVPRGLGDGRLVDVSEHPDIAELYMAADVLVTDYSSTMFDFAVTGRPMVFWTYDLDEYRDSVRGFYFDLESAAPGAVVRRIEDVAAALSDAESLPRSGSHVYDEFVARFCPREDGSASQRVVEAVFNGDG